MSFPPGFVWGAASSAFQIEGAHDADGKGPSNWDAFGHDRPDHAPPGGIAAPNVYMRHTGDVACDHYHRFPEDVALMKAIGLQAYRFSISWPRVIPDGLGAVNDRGLAFYDRLVDALLAAGITPWVTLYHWDTPLALWDRGSWLNPDIPHWFARYTHAVVDRLSDRVTHWITLNEPQIFLGPGEHEGLQTSNARRGHAERLRAAHNALLAHGHAVQVIRARARSAPSVGWAPIGRAKVPVGGCELIPSSGSTHPDAADRPLAPRPEDVEAARIATHAVIHKDFWNNAWFADPVFLGHYPEDGLRLFAHDAPRPAPGDMETIRQPLDFYGINVYDAELVRMGHDHKPHRVDFPPGHARNALGWFVCPEALYYTPRFLYERYRCPMVITENGFSAHDWVDLDGRVRDPQRIDYTRRYLRQLRRAIAEATDVRGYFHWSIMDNFEWQCGYRERFGLIHVDYTTLRRTLKDSAHWYARVIATRGQALDHSPEAVLSDSPPAA
jgi:beta-glucosidase